MYETAKRLRGIRECSIYTVQGCTLSDITNDENGAYNKTNTSNGKFVVLKDEKAQIKLVPASTGSPC